jgi:hypothetical protein
VLHEFGQYSFDIGSVSLDVSFFRFMFKVLGVDGHIVHVNCQPFLSYFVGEYGVHHCLEGGWGIGESEEHDGGFE